MAKLLVSAFQQWDLTPEEEKSGILLNENQKRHLHNLRADIALEKIGLTYSPENANRIIELDGQLGILNKLIQDCEQLEADLRRELEISAQLK